MFSSFSIGSSENALVINLEKVQLEEIVEKKLTYFLNQRQNLFEQGIFRKFYTPVEQALLELALEKYSGNQLRAADFLGINRNTLKKKLTLYNLNIKALLLQKKERNYPISRIFLSSLSSLDLLSASRSKLAWMQIHNRIPGEKVLKQMGQPVEKKIIQTALLKCKGNQIRASRLLGINRNTLKKKVNEDLKKIKACL